MDDDDAIAIVGIGCKFPGADNKDEFWKVLVNGENHVNEIPPDRWKNEAFYSSDQNTPGKTYVRHAGLLKSHDGFDHKFFCIGKMEADRMDPQQRYVLECVHMAMEDGGITRKMINGSDTGVFIGCMNNDYKESSSDDLTTTTHYTVTGVSPSIIAARVSYVYNLLGPSMVIDTACSSALVAIDVAVQHITTGRCSMVVCGGVNSILSPDGFIPLCRAQMVSPTGQCKAFSDKADGYARGEGCGILILKKLGDAKRDRNKIWATIATDCNQDGNTTTPITAPSGRQQENLLRRIYSSNNINPQDIQVIEAHGTGTPIGDPVEANALGHFFGRNTKGESKSEQIYIASVKTNIGHLESAAGVAGLIKVLLMMKNREIVPSLHFVSSNPKIDFERYGFVVPSDIIPWKSNKYKHAKGRLACVNSFGFGGTNSHAIIKENTSIEDTPKQNHTSSHHLVFISSCHPAGLKVYFSKFSKQVQTTLSKLSDISYTSLCRRDHFQHRIAVVATSLDDLKNKCLQREKLVVKAAPVQLKYSNIVAVFCGMATNWKGMCRELLQNEPTVKETIQKIDRIISKWIDWSVFDCLANSLDLTDPMVAHITLFTCQVAVWSLWEHWGITIDVVVGQSVGEVAASYAAGCLTLEQAIKVIFRRSSILANATDGRMFVVGNCQTEHIEAVCNQFQGKACIAVYSSSSSCTVSCDSDIVDELKLKIKEGLSIEEMQELFMKDLNVQCAFHSHHTKGAGIKLEEILQHDNLQGRVQSKRIISTVSGREASSNEYADPCYWKQNVSQKVLFKSAILCAGSNKGFNIFLEIGPQPVLHAHLRDLYNEAEAVSLPSLTRNSEYGTLFDTVAQLFEYGVTLDWNKVYKGDGKLIDLPGYVLQPTNELYIPAATHLRLQGLQQNCGSHLFVERTPGDVLLFRVNINEMLTPFVFEHFVSNTTIVPGAFYVEVALEVARSQSKNRTQDVAVKVDFIRPLGLSKGKSYSLDVMIKVSDSDEQNYVIQKSKSLITEFSFKSVDGRCSQERINIEVIRQTCCEFQSADETYATLRKFGFTYGKDLRILGDAFKNEHQCIVQMHVSDAIWDDIKTTHLHPAILDGLLQTLGILKPEGTNDKTFLPAGIEELRLRRWPDKNMIGYAEIKRRSENEIVYNMLLLTVDGSIIAEVNDFKVRNVTDSSINHSLEYAIVWQEIDIIPKAKEFSFKTQKMLVFSFYCTLLSNIEGVYKDNEVSVCLLNQDNTLETQKNIIRSKLHNDPFITHICFAPGLTLDGLATGTTVLEAIQSTCVVMLAVVQILASYTKNISVVVITENTQVRDNNNLTHFNVVGSELWGQVRSILREYDSVDICLLDCQPSVVAALGFIEQLCVNRSSFDYTELMFADGRLFTNKLSQTNRQIEPIFRSTAIDENIKVEIKARNPNDLRELFCVIQSGDNISVSNTTLVTENACLHDPVLHPTTFPGEGCRVSPLLGSNENGFSVLTFEITANVMNDPTRDQIRRSSNRESTVVACFPMKVQTVVSVPSSCVYSLRNLPAYQPGMQLVAVLMRSLAEHTKEGESIHILCDKADILPGYILQLMLKTKNCRVRILTEDATNPTVSKLIPLKRCKISEIMSFIELDSIATVISLSTFIDQDTRMMFEAHDIDVILVHTEDILCKRNLERLNPDVFKFMSKHIGLLSDVKPRGIHYKSIIPIPCQTFSLTFENIGKYKSVNISKNMPFRLDCCYIIIGGLTGLGWELVNLLANHQAGEVISLSRREPDAQTYTALKSLSHKTGCHIRTFSTDITNFKSLQKTFQQIQHYTKRAIKGIFQGASVLHDTLSIRMDESQLLDALRPKVLGTWNLHLVSQDYSLDYFVMQSSMTSVMGNIGQSNYGAANAFMDGLAYYRRMNGFCGQSINWGPLAMGMIKGDQNTLQFLQSQGYFLLEISEISECFKTALHCNSIQVTFGKFDWNLIRRSMSAMNGNLLQQRFRSLLQQDNNKSRSSVEHTSTDEIIDILKAPSNEREAKITTIVLQTASEYFSIDIGLLSKETSLRELGIDSMQSMTFSNKIQDLTGIRISVVTLMSDETTLGTVIDMLHKHIIDIGRESNPNQVVDGSVENCMTPMEKKVYDAYLFDQYDPSLFSYADLSVSYELADPLVWRNIMKQVQIKHSALRTVFIPDQDLRYGVRKQIVDSSEASIDFLSVSIQELEHEEKLPHDLTHYLFDPSTDFPMRILFAREHTKCIVRFVFNHLSLDLKSIWIVVSDIIAIRNSTESSLQPDIDIAAIYDKKLQGQKPKLVKYWNENTPKSLQSMSFKSGTDAALNPKFFNFSKLLVGTDIIGNLNNFLVSQNIKLFDFVVSLYQLLLHAELEQNTITVFTTVDMRIHFEEVKNIICRFTNTIPLYVKIEKETNVVSFMKNNKKSLACAIENSLLPFDEISEFVQNMKPGNVFRHQLTMEQVESSNYYENRIHMKRVSTGAYYNETVLYVWHDLENGYLEFELGYSSLMIEIERANNCLNRLLYFISCIINNPDATIDSLTNTDDEAAANM